MFNPDKRERVVAERDRVCHADHFQDPRIGGLADAVANLALGDVQLLAIDVDVRPSS